MALNKERILGIDYARAFFSICVVGTHLTLILWSRIQIFNTQMYENHIFSLSGFVYFYILLLAVPAFFIISNYIFACRPYEPPDLVKRLTRYIKLFLFWSIMYNLITKGVILLPSNAEQAVTLFLSGNDTLFYFFVSLGILTTIVHFAKRLSNSLVIILAILSTFFVGTLPLISIKYEFYSLSIYWNPLNFLPFPFAAVIIQRFKSQRLRSLYWNTLIIALTVLAFLTCILDWTIYANEGFKVNLYAIPAYTRPSIVVLSVLLLVIVVNFRFKEFVIVNFMAKHSLALYCLHCFFLKEGPQVADMLQLTGAINWLVSLIIVVSISYICSLILPYFLREDLIR